MKHRDMCIAASAYLRNKLNCKYSVCELERCGESPDAFGFGGAPTTLIEVKTSRRDFLSDKYKIFRRNMELGIGSRRYYMCPDGIITASDLPPSWGLLCVDNKNKIKEVVMAGIQEKNHHEEIDLICSIFRREGIPPKTFSYKKYKNL